jgi:hypothetical protein
VSDLANGVGKVSTIGSTLLGAIQFAGISGIIAIMITATICYITVNGTKPDEGLPKTLELALTTILGFYFGTAVQKAVPKWQILEEQNTLAGACA